MNKTLKLASYYGQVLLGTACSAFAMACFALPYNMVVAGISGIGKIINTYTGAISISLAVTIVSGIFFILGAVFLGWKFASSIILVTIAYPFFLALFQSLDVLQQLVDEPLLAAIAAGVIDGAGVGMAVRVGASTGGIDIPTIILNRKLGWKVATTISIFDITIFALQIPFTSSNGIILGILYVLIYSMVLDRVLMVGQGGVQIMIFSIRIAEINEALLKLGYGTTLLKGKGGYIQTDRNIVYCVASARRLHSIKNTVLAIDPGSFITISNVNEISGNGFTENFSDERYVNVVANRRAGQPVEDGAKK